MSFDITGRECATTSNNKIIWQRIIRRTISNVEKCATLDGRSNSIWKKEDRTICFRFKKKKILMLYRVLQYKCAKLRYVFLHVKCNKKSCRDYFKTNNYSLRRLTRFIRDRFCIYFRFSVAPLVNLTKKSRAPLKNIKYFKVFVKFAHPCYFKKKITVR